MQSTVAVQVDNVVARYWQRFSQSDVTVLTWHMRCPIVLQSLGESAEQASVQRLFTPSHMHSESASQPS